MLCVNCDVFYVRDGDYDSSKHKLTTTPASSSAAAPAPASTSKLAAKDNSDFDEQIEALLDEEIEAYAEQERQRLSAREAALLQASASVGPSPSSLSLLNSKVNATNYVCWFRRFLSAGNRECDDQHARVQVGPTPKTSPRRHRFVRHQGRFRDHSQCSPKPSGPQAIVKKNKKKKNR